MYCDQVREIGKAVLQYSHCNCDTVKALGAGARHGARRRRRAGALGARSARALGACGRWASGARPARNSAQRHSARRYGHLAYDTARPGLRNDATVPTTWPRVRGLGSACACWLGQIGCLVHLTHFDSVFGLSPVSESLFGHYS